MNLNVKQRKIAIVGVVLFVFMGLIPPWTYTLNAQSIHREKPAGYALIISPPVPEDDNPAFGVKIDISRLIIQWLVLAAATGLGAFITRSHDKE